MRLSFFEMLNTLCVPGYCRVSSLRDEMRSCGLVAHLRSARAATSVYPHAPSADASCEWGYYGVMRRWRKSADTKRLAALRDEGG